MFDSVIAAAAHGASADLWESGAELIRGRKCLQDGDVASNQAGGREKRSSFHRVTLSGGCYGPQWTSTPSASGPVKMTDRRACTHAHAQTHTQLQGPGTPNLKPHAFWDPASFPGNPALEQGSPPPPPALGLSAGTMKE